LAVCRVQKYSPYTAKLEFFDPNIYYKYLTNILLYYNGNIFINFKTINYNSYPLSINILDNLNGYVEYLLI